MAISKKKGSPYYYTRFSICGIRIQESTLTTIKSEAQEYEEKRRREVRDQVVMGKKPDYTWDQAGTRWLKEKKHKRSLVTDIFHFNWLEQHLKGISLKDITKDKIEAIALQKEKENVEPSTVNRILQLIRAVLNTAYKQWEWIDKVPIFRMRKEHNKRIRWLTKEEVERLYSYLPPHLKPLVQFSLATGLRQANVLELRWEDVNLALKHVTVHPDKAKAEKGLPIPLNADAIEVLLCQTGQHSDFVFTYKGRPIKQCNTKAWRNALSRAEITNFRWHDLRHTWASWHVQSGTSLQELQQLGGWANFETVLRYAHLSSHHLQKAANRIVEVEHV